MEASNKFQRSYKSQSVKLNKKNFKFGEFKRTLSTLDERKTDAINMSKLNHVFKRKNAKKAYARQITLLDFGIHDIIMDQFDHSSESFDEKLIKIEDKQETKLILEETSAKQKVLK